MLHWGTYYLVRFTDRSIRPVGEWNVIAIVLYEVLRCEAQVERREARQLTFGVRELDFDEEWWILMLRKSGILCGIEWTRTVGLWPARLVEAHWNFVVSFWTILN